MILTMKCKPIIEPDKTRVIGGDHEIPITKKRKNKLSIKE
jgi:hypothetical protein